MRVVGSFKLSSRSHRLCARVPFPRPCRACEAGAGDPTLSTRPDTVSGGDVLVQINVPETVPLNSVTVNLNGLDVTAAFRPGQAPGSLVGLVERRALGGR